MEIPRRTFIKGAISRTLWILGGAILAYPVFSFITYRRRRKRTVIFQTKDQTSSVVYKEGVYLIRAGEEAYAFSAKCTHLGCRFNYDPISRRFRCPCHGSVFDLSGKRLAGPAEKDLERAPLSMTKGGERVVTLDL